MPYSPTLSAGTSTAGKLVTTLLNYEQNASSAEKPMLMAELTYTLLSISGGSSDADGPTYSMLTAITQTFHQRTLHHKAASTMRARMVTLSQGNSKDQKAAIELGAAIRGLTSSLAALETSFIQHSWHLLHDLCAPPFLLWKSMPTGDIALIQSRIDTTQSYVSTWIHFQNCLNGQKSSLREAQNHVRILHVEKGDPPGTKSSGSRYACSRGPSPPLSRVRQN